MNMQGFRWTLRPEGDGWFWQAVARADKRLVAQGHARDRAVAAACLVRAISRGAADDLHHPIAA